MTFEFYGANGETFSDKPFTSGGVKHFPKWAYSETYKKWIKKHDRAMTRKNSDAYRTRAYKDWKEAA